MAFERYEKNGDKKDEPEPAEAFDMYGTADGESQEETEEVMGVFAGATGKIIGPKGSKIQEIKSASNVKDIKMPTRQEGFDRPRARDLVEITILGKPRAIRKAMELIQEVVDEWVCVPPLQISATCGRIMNSCHHLLLS
jgi:hypothetical protein